MTKKIRWGVLGAAKIAVTKVIPAMQQGSYSKVDAIASRNRDTAQRTAQDLRIPKFYDAYDKLIADPEIDAIYNPLPNNLHVEWTIKAAASGKHVLCEKPLALTTKDVRKLIAARDQTGVKIQEAFMVRTHPMWRGVRDLIGNGRIGNVRAINAFFSYYNDDPRNIRNQTETGGGALFDIGCYCINLSRFVLNQEPRKVWASIERDPQLNVDILTSSILDFPACQSTFTCGTQLVPFQRMQFFGTSGRIEIEIPFNIPVDQPTKILIDDGSNLFGDGVEKIEFPTANQYTIQGDVFSQAILENSAPAISLEDSLMNTAIIEAIFRAAKSGTWETPESL